MKRLLLTLYQSLFLFSIICAGTVKVGKLWYNIDMQELTAEVIKSVDGEYYDEIVIPKQVDYEHITFNVTSIGDKAFYDCDSISSVIIPEGIKSIGKMAFMGCTPPSGSRYNGIKVINVPNSVLTIGGQAFAPFSMCTGLTSIYIPENVNIIGSFGATTNPFLGCSSLSTIVVDNNNKTYDSRKDCNAIIETNSNTLISGCGNTRIPEGITALGDDSFRWCENVTYMEMPKTINSIGHSAFEGCKDLTIIKSYIEEPPEIGKWTFKDCYETTILYVPYGTVEKYKQTAGWNLFVHIAELEKDQTSIIHPKSDRNKSDNIFNLNGCKMH